MPLRTVLRATLLAAALPILAACREDASVPTAPTPPERPSLTLARASSYGLGTLGGTYTTAIRMHANGRVVGSSAIAGDAHYHAFLWTPGTGMRDLGTIGGLNSEGEDVNASGQVAGRSDVGGVAAEHAALWTPGAPPLDLGTLGGTYSLAYGINDAGQVVGRAMIATNSYHAFLWTPADGMRDLGTLGGSYSEARRIDAAGRVIGISYLADENSVHGFRWTAAGGMQDLGTIGGGSSDARDINAAGTVVGESGGHAFVWTPELGMQDLGSLGGATSWSAEATDINDAGQVVGSASTPGGQHAFLWTHDAGMRDLGTLGGISSAAASIDAAGRVVGWSYFSADNGAGVHGFLWTPEDGMEDIFNITGIRRAAFIADGLRVLGDNRIGELRTDFRRPIAADVRVLTAPKRAVSVTLGGTSPDGVTITAWTITTPPAHGTLSGSAPHLTYTPDRKFEGTDTFGYTVTDARGMTSAPALVTIVVDRANHAPVLSSGGPYAGSEGTPVVFDWSASDADGGGLAYTWDFGDGSVGAGSHLPKQHRYADNGTYVLHATVSDGAGGSDAQTTTVTVANVAPTIRSVRLSDETVVLKDGMATVTVRNVVFDDPAGRVDAPYVTAIYCGSGSTIADGSRRCRYTSAGTYTLTITVADKEIGISAPVTATVHVVE